MYGPSSSRADHRVDVARRHGSGVDHQLSGSTKAPAIGDVNPRPDEVCKHCYARP